MTLPLHTVGNQIRDSNDTPILFRGASWSDLVDDNHPHTWQQGSDRAAYFKNNGANSVCIKIGFQRIYPGFPFYSPNTQVWLDNWIDGCETNELYAYIIFHHDVDTYQWIVNENHWSDYIDFFVSLVQRYQGKNSFCGVHWWNEPFSSPQYTITPETWFNSINSLITQAHQVNPNMLVMFSDINRPGGQGWGSIPSDANNWVDPNIQTNFLWAFHHYFWQDLAPHRQTFYEVQYQGRDQQEGFQTGKNQLRDYLLYDRNLQMVYTDSFPVIDDEFGYYGVNSPLPAPSNPDNIMVFERYEPCWDRLNGTMQAEIDFYELAGINWTYYVGGAQGSGSYGLWQPPFNTVPSGPTDKGWIWLNQLAVTRHLVSINNVLSNIPVNIDGVTVGVTPVSLELAQGNHTFNVPQQIET